MEIWRGRERGGGKKKKEKQPADNLKM